MVRTQRLYKTNIDYQTAKDAIVKGKGVFLHKYDYGPEKGEKLLSFRLARYPKVPLQLTPKQHILMLHGVKPNRFLFDLNIIRELVSAFSESFPHGIDFKLYKEDYSYYDKDEIIEKLKEQLELLERLLVTCMTKGTSMVEDNIQVFRDVLDTDASSHNQFAEQANDFFARVVCTNGFRCKPDGTLKIRANKPPDPFLKHSVRILFKSRFLQE